VPVRAFGKLMRDSDGQLVFTYRPWLVLRSKTAVLPTGKTAIGRALINPSLLVLEGESWRELIQFPPRYRTHEEGLAQVFGCSEVRDIGLLGIWNWFLELIGLRRPRSTAHAQG
ncbi:MAG: hypothetical protein N3G20_07125, partial [Verrucomicrobiae bacterium]|nr:hypothetical protein [Verrucomicrobiae bacterium]